jgi:hypothetical protein
MYLVKPSGLEVPYIERRRLLLIIGMKSYTPRTTVYPTPGKSLARPPCTSTLLYFEHRYPAPGIRVVTFKPLVRLTLATCRTAELGFFGLIVVTFVTMPLRCGFCFRRCARGVYDLECVFALKEVCFNVAKF